MGDLLSFVMSQGDQFRRQRMPSLYADFTLQRHSNPDGYAANTLVWINALSKAAQAGLVPADGGDHDTLSLRTGDALLQSLETKEWGRPLALGPVINEAVSQRRLVPYQQFLAARRSIYYRSWTVQPWWLLSWGMRQVGLFEPSIGAGTLPVGRFVILQNVEEAAGKILRQMGGKQNHIDRILPMTIFKARVAKTLNLRHGLTNSDLEIMLIHLGRDKSAIIYDTQTVKFKDTDETSNTLSDQDRTMSSLKSVIADINVQMIQLSIRIAALSENAQTAIRQNNRVSALAALKSKKLNETILSQRSQSLSQLEDVYRTIEQAADQVTVVRVMKSSTAVLRNLHAEVGGVDKVEDIVEGLRDEMSKVDEVSSVLEAGGQGHTIIDESAVDDELEAMERHAKMEAEERVALETQGRLASIDEVGRAADSKPTQDQKSAEDEDALIKEDIEALKRLSLDAKVAATGKGSNVPQATAG